MLKALVVGLALALLVSAGFSLLTVAIGFTTTNFGVLAFIVNFVGGMVVGFLCMSWALDRYWKY